jgi:hypothetical protein
VQRLAGVRHDQLRIDVERGAEAVAGRAGAEGVVEGKQARLDLVDGETRDRTGEARGMAGPLAGIGVLREGQAFGQGQRRLEAVGQARLQTGAHHQPVDHHFDVVLALLVERRGLVDLGERAVDLDPLETALLQFGQLLAVLALATAHDRRQQVESRALGQLHDPVDHLADGLALDRQAGGRRIGDADPGEEQAQVVVNLGHRADRRARVLGGRLLLDRDCRREAFDRIDLGLLHQL